MDKLVKLAIVVGVLLAGIGFFYHYVIFLPSVEQKKVAAAEHDELENAISAARVERERITAVEHERQIAETRENQRKMVYENCIGVARLNNEENWASACKSLAKKKAAEHDNCLNDPLVMNNEFMGANYCKQMYGGSDASSSCALPSTQANYFIAFHKEAQEKCVTEARLGLR